MKARSRNARRYSVVLTVAAALIAGMTTPALASTKPVAVNDSYTVHAGDQHIRLDVLVNDESPSGAPLKIDNFDSYLPGVSLSFIDATGGDDGTHVVLYADVEGNAAPGIRNFGYSVTDGMSSSEYGTINIDLPAGTTPTDPGSQPVPLTPDARDDQFAPRGKGTFVYDVLANDDNPAKSAMSVIDWSSASSGGYNGYYHVSLTSDNKIKVVSEAFLPDNLVIRYIMTNGEGSDAATAVLPFAGVSQLKVKLLVKPRKYKAGRIAVINDNVTNAVQFNFRENYGGRNRKWASGIIRPQTSMVMPIRLKRHVKGHPYGIMTSYLLIPGAQRQGMRYNRVRL